jgi:hypothetical protein
MDPKYKSSMYFFKNEFTPTFESFCESNSEKLKREFEVEFGDKNPLGVTYEVHCHLSYWARRINFYESTPFEQYFKHKDGKFQFCNYLIDFIDIFASNLVEIPESYPQEIADLFLKSKSKTFKDKAYKASFYLSVAMLSMDNQYNKRILENNKTIRENIKSSGYYKSLSDKNKIKFDKAITDKIDAMNSNEEITNRNFNLEKNSGFYKNLCESFLNYYHNEKLSDSKYKTDKIFENFIKKIRPELYSKGYKWETFKKTFYKYGYKLK